MSIYLRILLLFFIHTVKAVKVQFFKGTFFVHIKAFSQEDENTTIKFDSGEQEHIEIPQFINEANLKYRYSNSDLGNDTQIPIEFCNERIILDYWIHGLPLILTTHGWLSSEKNYSGVFIINTAYINVGGFNVISVDWSSIAEDPKYPVPAALTKAVGSAIANFLDRLVDVTGIDPLHIHLIGHSLGAHVVGSCGFHFKSGKIGRITGLDAAAPGYEAIPIHLPHLNKKDAQFVDCIHTSGGFLGYSSSIGHADFYPNSGRAPQPGCYSLFDLLDFLHCSHSRSYELYADSVYYRKSLVAVSCPSWEDFEDKKCEDNTCEFMGHDTPPSARGDFFLKTRRTSPYGINV